MDAEGYDAAVEAADRRIAQLMGDLGRLVLLMKMGSLLLIEMILILSLT
mgnify:CR=1 FL=1